MQTMAKPKELDPIEEQLRVNLVTFIEETGYSQNQIADMSGVPQASLGRYIRGENALQVSVMKSLADVFGRTVDDFYNPHPPPYDPSRILPFFMKHRPGAVLTAEDQKDYDEFMERARQRKAAAIAAEKKKGKK